MRFRRFATALMVASLVIGLGFIGSPPGRVLAEDDPAASFMRSPSDEEFEPAVDLSGLASVARVAVMLKLFGDPAAVVQGRTPGKQLSDGQKDAIKKELRVRQDSLRGAIESLGGTVQGQFQVALNGMRVEIGRDKLEELARLPGVVAISPVELYQPDNATSVPFIGAPAVWNGATGLRGEGVKIAIIDTGIDYTHANFGGPGTTAAFSAARATSAGPANPALFGPDAPKVKGGIDLVGDAYNGANVPRPDPNPLDCNGHGSHVAGTAGGLGVRADGATYTGPYNASTLQSTSFRIGPGVAPKADLYAVRVFGCEGGTRVVVDGIDWAIDNHMDVINMSLGSVFGLPDAATAEASDNAAQAGLIVVAAAGNSGSAPYITGSPAVASRAISVAGTDSTASFPAAALSLTKPGQTTSNVTALNSNNATFANGTSRPIFVLRSPDGGVSLGCDEAEWMRNARQIAGKLVVTLRGVCPRVDRAIFGQRRGASAVAMINNAPGLPPFEGDIFDGDRLVTIPFLGVRSADRSALVAKDSGAGRYANAAIANPDFRAFASFTSGGPRSADGVLKPDISAPGVAVNSTAVGTGNRGARFSGTSMATPHVAGVAALTKQAHPTWSSDELKAAIVNTGDPAGVAGYRTSRGGTGLAQPVGATRTAVVAMGADAMTSLSFGFAELHQDFRGDKAFRVRNNGTAPATFTISAAATAGSQPHSVALPVTSITVEPGQERQVRAVLTVPAATAGDSTPTPLNVQAFREVAGLITLTPAAGSNRDVALRMPYYLVPRALSNVDTSIEGKFGPSRPTAVATVRNPGAADGIADFHAWGLESPDRGLGEIDLRAVGVKSLPSATFGRLLVFAVNTFRRWSNPSVDEFILLIDVDGDGVEDFLVAGVDFGLVTAGGFDGRMASVVLDLRTGRARIRFFANAPTDSSTLLLPVVASDLGLSPARPRFDYSAVSVSLRDLSFDVIPGPAKFNAFKPAITLGQSVSLAPNATAAVPLAIDPEEFALTPPLGIMVVTLDNAAGKPEAQLIRVRSD